MLAIGCVVTASAKPSMSYAYLSSDQLDPKNCDQAAGAYKTVIADSPAGVLAVKSKPMFGYYSQISHDLIQPVGTPMARVAAVPAVTPLLKTELPVQMKPEAVSTQWIESEPAPAVYKAPIEPLGYVPVTSAPILRTADIEPGRVLPVAPITASVAPPLLESKLAADQSAFEVNRALLKQSIDTSAWQTRLQAIPAPAVKLVDTQIGFKEPAQYAIAAPLVKTKFVSNVVQPYSVPAPMAMSYSYTQPKYSAYQTFTGPQYYYAGGAEAIVQKPCDK